MTVQTQIRIDQDTKKNANIIFAQLGLDMSTAVNIFLNQCILRGGLPFTIEIPHYTKETLEAMEEAEKIAKDKNEKGYSSMDDLKRSLEE